MTDILAYSMPDAAKLVGVSHHLLRTQIRAGKLRAIKLGRRTVIKRTALEDWIHNAPPLVYRKMKNVTDEVRENVDTLTGYAEILEKRT